MDIDSYHSGDDQELDDYSVDEKDLFENFMEPFFGKGAHLESIEWRVLDGVMSTGDYKHVYPRSTFVRLLNSKKCGSDVTAQDLWGYAEFMSRDDSECGWGPMSEELVQALDSYRDH